VPEAEPQHRRPRAARGRQARRRPPRRRLEDRAGPRRTARPSARRPAPAPLLARPGCVRAALEPRVPGSSRRVCRRPRADQARVVGVPLAVRGDSYEYDLEALLGAVTPATTLLIVCTPNNPTGNSLSTDDLRRCAEAAPQVLVDAAYVDFELGADHSSLLREHE